MPERHSRSFTGSAAGDRARAGSRCRRCCASPSRRAARPWPPTRPAVSSRSRSPCTPGRMRSPCAAGSPDSAWRSLASNSKSLTDRSPSIEHRRSPRHGGHHGKESSSRHAHHRRNPRTSSPTIGKHMLADGEHLIVDLARITRPLPARRGDRPRISGLLLLLRQPADRPQPPEAARRPRS